MTQELRVKSAIKKLQDRGYRITNQRKLLLDIVLSNECASCKEIYFAAKKKDGKVGIATVYRTVQMLEDVDLVKKGMIVQMDERE